MAKQGPACDRELPQRVHAASRLRGKQRCRCGLPGVAGFAGSGAERSGRPDRGLGGGTGADRCRNVADVRARPFRCRCVTRVPGFWIAGSGRAGSGRTSMCRCPRRGGVGGLPAPAARPAFRCRLVAGVVRNRAAGLPGQPDAGRSDDQTEPLIPVPGRLCGKPRCGCAIRQERGTVVRRRRRALPSTNRLDSAIAPAASIGDSDRPVSGCSTPAATGISSTL